MNPTAIKEAAKIIDIAEKEWERELEEEAQRRSEAFWEAQKRCDENWLTEHAGISSPLWCGPTPEEKIPPEGYWRVPGTLREWLQILGVKDIITT